MTQIVFFDTEYTAWEDSMATNWSLPGHHREIVQIGALRFDTSTMAFVDEILITIRPQANPELSDYFMKLTGITQADADAGLPFEDAMDDFYAYLNKDPAVSYGNDAGVINENFQLHAYNELFTGYNIRDWFQEHGTAFGINPKTNSGKLAETLGLTFNKINEHNALHDVRSIAAAYAYLVKKGAPPFVIPA